MPLPKHVLHITTEISWRGGEVQLSHLINGLQARQVPCSLLAYPDSKITQHLKGTTPCFPLSSGFYSWCRDIKTALQTSQADIVHVHSSRGVNLGFIAKYLDPNVRLVFSKRVEARQMGWFSRTFKYKNPRLDGTIAISKAIAAQLVGAGVSPQKVFQVYSGIDTQEMAGVYQHREELVQEKRNHLHLGEQIKILGAMGHLCEKKGFDLLIKSLTRLPHEVHLILVGDGPEKNNLQQLAKTLGVVPRVHCVGFQQRPHEWIPAFDVFCHASEWEGLGTVLMDSLFFGCPTIASNVGGIPEIILHEQTGLLFPVNDLAALCGQIEIFLNNKDYALRLASQGRMHILNHFTMTQMVAGNLQVYEHLASF